MCKREQIALFFIPCVNVYIVQDAEDRSQSLRKQDTSFRLKSRNMVRVRSGAG